jgi:hypothetical protein
MDSEALVKLLESGQPPDAGFHHREHVQVAWWYLRHYALPDALARFATALRRFADAQGKPGLYHETITTAFVLLINERLHDDRGAGWPAFAARNADLMTWHPSILDRYYLAGTLASDRARRTFVMPDRLSTTGPLQ